MGRVIEHSAILSMRQREADHSPPIRIDLREHRSATGTIDVTFSLSHHGRIINRWTYDMMADQVPLGGPIYQQIEWPEKPYRDGRTHPIPNHTYKMQAKIVWDDAA